MTDTLNSLQSDAAGCEVGRSIADEQSPVSISTPRTVDPEQLRIAFLMHEFRSHLNVVVNTSILLRGCRDKLDAKGNALLSAQQVSAELLTVLADDLACALVDGRQNWQTNLQSLQLRPWLEAWHERISMLPSGSGGRSTLEFSPVACAPVVLADAFRLNQCLFNLLTNAQRYGASAAGTRLGLDVGDHEARLSVTDFGVGMKPEHADRLFVPFDRLGQDSSVPGQGLGLALTKTLVEAMGGRLEVRTSQGAGSTFSLVFPLVT